MNMKKIIGLVLAIVVIATSFTGCELVNNFIGGGDNEGGGSTGKNSLLMEAEYTYMDEVAGAGISDGTSGLSMIYGQGTDAQKAKWSGGYYVGYMHNSNSVLTFEFNSSKATSATLTFSIGCELNDMVLTSGENLAILVNGAEQFFTWSVTCSELDSAEFFKYTLTGVQLAAGANKIEIKVLPQDPNPARGPLVDCIKVVASDSSVELNWSPKTDNPYRRDNEV